MPDYYSFDERGPYTPRTIESVQQARGINEERARNAGVAYASRLAPWGPGRNSPWMNLLSGGGNPPAVSYPADPAQSNGPNPYFTLRNTRNPQIASILDRILGQADQAASLNGNPYTLYSNTKDQDQAGRIGDVANQLGQTQGQNRQTLADFTRSYLGGQGKVDQYTQQEADSLGQYYNGGVQGNLDALARAREIAVARSTDRALGRAQGALNSNRLQFGDSSNLNSQYLNTAADVYARNAADQANINRDDYWRVRGGQDANAGRRQSLYDASQSRMLLPIQAQSQLSASELAQTGQLGALNDANRFYQLQTPEDALMRRLGVLGAAGQVDQYARTYGLGAPREPDFSGFNYTQPRRPLGNYYAPQPSYYEPTGYGGADSGNQYGYGSGGGPTVDSSPYYSPASNQFRPQGGYYPFASSAPNPYEGIPPMIARPNSTTPPYVPRVADPYNPYDPLSQQYDPTFGY